MKKMLMVATVPSMIGQFNMNNINLLQEMGYKVHVACDFEDRSVWNEKRILEFKYTLSKMNIDFFQISFTRSPLNIMKHISSYKQLKKIVIEEKYDFIHCHTPIASAVTRLVCKNTNTKCIYTAHGFHFYKGAPLKNWIVFYPIEKILSRYTDILITINNEDYERALKKFKAKEIVYVPGVGIDIQKFEENNSNRREKRKEMSISQDDIMMLSVGELSHRKNHEMVIRAIAKLNNYKIKYYICGIGQLYEYLNKMVNELNLNNQVFFLEYRTDIKELCYASDIFVFSSKQEGLPVALMEAIACKVPVICSNIRGNADLITDSNNMFNPDNLDELVECLKNKFEIKQEDNLVYTIKKDFIESCNINKENLKKFSIENVSKCMKEIYKTKI